MLGVVILVVAIFALRHPRSTTVAAGTPTKTVTLQPAKTLAPSKTSAKHGSAQPSTRASTASSAAAAQHLPLVILNNSGDSNVGIDAQQAFQNAGWTVTSQSAYSNNILSTAAYYDPSVPGSQADASALQQRFPAIQRVVPKFDGLPAGPIVVVLNPGFSS